MTNALKKTVTIGLSAYNEQENITHFLTSLLGQIEESFSIKEVIIASDGSTDNTVNNVCSISDQRIRILHDNERKGKPSRLNQIFQSFDSDILVIFDADVLLDTPWTLEHLIKPFIHNPDLSYVSGNAQPLPAITFIEKASNSFMAARNANKHLYDYSTTIYGTRGCSMAFSRTFAKTLQYPETIISEDGYCHLYAQIHGLKHAFSEKAVVRYRSVQNMSDYMKQCARYAAASKQLEHYFDISLLTREFAVPTEANLAYMKYQLKTNPIGYIVLKFLTILAPLKGIHHALVMGALWDIVASTKNLSTPTRKGFIPKLLKLRHFSFHSKYIWLLLTKIFGIEI